MRDFRAALQRWYRRHGRHDLPWRMTRDPYAVLVSEVMLQQTQVERVLPYYTSWLGRWPGAVQLASAPLPDVIRAWSGLGYNRRAMYLHRSATAAVERFGGEIPSDREALLGLPGVGPYTASAVACFAAGTPVPVADTNIARVLARVELGVADRRDTSAAAIETVARALVPGHGARDHNLALMDLGAMVCTARTPLCAACPVSDACAWRASGCPPGTRPQRRVPPFEETARFARGRIVDALRLTPLLDVEALSAILPPRHVDALPRYLFGLESDGLIEQIDGYWALAGTQGSSSIASPKL